ncbi:MAG: CoA transferase, partial [Rhodanobacter sp.]
EWETLFGDEVPCAAARQIEDMFDHPQVQAQGIIDAFEHPVVGRYRGVAQSIRFGRTPGPAAFAAPVLGQHTATVLAAIEADAPVACMPREARKG